MNKVLVCVVDNDNGSYSIMLSDDENYGIDIEIKCENQERANAIYTALIGNAVNVI